MRTRGGACDGRAEQQEIGYEQVPIASPYLLSDEVIPHFKAPFLLNALVTLQRINDSLLL
jgi:hypothetical protein